MPVYNLDAEVSNPQGHAMKDGGPISQTKEDGSTVVIPAPTVKIGGLCFIAMQAPHESDGKLSIADKKKNFAIMMKVSGDGEISLTSDEVKTVKDRLWQVLHYSSAGLGELALDKAEVKDKVSETKDVAPVE